MGTGIYGKLPEVLDYLVVPGKSNSIEFIKYLSDPPKKLNLSLVRDKATIWWEYNNKLSLTDGDKQIIDDLQLNRYQTRIFKNSNAKSKFIESIKDTYLKGIPEKEQYNKLLSNREKIIQDRLNLSFTAETASRMQVGSNETVLETRLLLHRLFGFPYIPGSALKGLALAAFFHSKKLVGFERKDKHGKIIPLNSTRLSQLRENYPGDFTEDIVKKIMDLFGAPVFPELGKKEQAGKVIFLDAWPEDLDGLLDLDSWTVHYPTYYDEKNTSQYPGDHDDPRPLLQLCVKKEAEFRFVLLADRGADENLLKETKRYLQMGLEHLSIGAKPDYGYFENFRDITN